MLLPGVRDKVLGCAGLQDSKFIDAFATKDTALFSKYWDAKADALVQDWSYASPGKGDHTDYFLWLHPPHYLLQQTVDKILLDQARNIMLIPVRKNQSWLWQMGEAAVDWWDSDPDIPIYCDKSGIVYKQSSASTTRVALFDAMGLRDTNDAFPCGAWPRDAAADTHKQAGRQSTALTRASSCSCHVTKRSRILATLKQGNKSMYSNTSGYVHMGLRLDWVKGITGQ